MLLVELYVCTLFHKFQDLSITDASKDDSRDKEAEKERELEQRRREDEDLRAKGRKDNRKHLEPTLTWIADDKKDEG